MEKDNIVSLTFSLAFLCQCGFPLDEITKVPIASTAIEVIWLSNTSHVLIDMAENPRVMNTIDLKNMIKRSSITFLNTFITKPIRLE